MSGDLVLRIAAKGDGVTETGQHVAGVAPGDTVGPDGAITAGPHRAIPPCRYFGTCGGCQLQHIDEASLGQFVTDRVVNAAQGQGLAPQIIAPPHLSPSASRRRASLRAERVGGRVLLGYREAASHRLVDLAQCPVIRPELAALLDPLRRLFAGVSGRLAADITLTLADQGVDCGIKGLHVGGLAATERMLAFAADHRLARLSLDAGYGAEPILEPVPVTVTLAGVPVALPPGAFLQATADGEAALTAAVREWLAGAATVADLFAGLGTFAFALAGQGTKVLAAEADAASSRACQIAAQRAGVALSASHRDLFRNPLLPDELDRFAGVILDPPRAGARDQVARLAASRVPLIAYLSCNPASWARDAAMLVAGGYTLAEVRPIGQFRWSTHVELASLFTR